MLEALENLAQANNEREYDLFMKGMVHAFREVLEWTPDVEKEKDDPV